MHLEGTLTPELRFKFAKRNGIVLSSARLGKTFETLEELREAYGLLAPRSVKGKGVSAFFEAYCTFALLALVVNVRDDVGTLLSFGLGMAEDEIG